MRHPFDARPAAARAQLRRDCCEHLASIRAAGTPAPRPAKPKAAPGPDLTALLGSLRVGRPGQLAPKGGG